MKNLQKVNQGQTILPLRAIAVGTGVGGVLTVLMSVGSAILVAHEHIPQGAVGYVTAITQIVSAFLGTLVAMLLSDRMPAMVSGMVSAVYFLMLIITNVLLFGGEFSRVGGGAVCILCGAVLALVLRILLQKKPKMKMPRKY